MDSVLGQPGGLGQATQSMTDSPATNPLVNPASMQPGAMANMMGSPLSNGGANMMPYMQMQEAFTPKPLQGGTSSPQTQNYNYGGLVSFADGGMPMPPQGGAPQDPSAGMPPQGGAPEGGLAGQAEQIDPELKAKVEQIFSENMQDPQRLSQMLLQLVEEEEIKKVVSPEQMKQLHSPEGQQMLQQIVEQMMAQMQEGGGEGGGALGQMAGGGGGGGAPGAPPAGGPPPGGAPQGGLPGMAYGGMVDYW